MLLNSLLAVTLAAVSPAAAAAGTPAGIVYDPAELSAANISALP